MPGMATTKANMAIHTLRDQSSNKARNTTTLNRKISQKAKPKNEVQMKRFGSM